MRLIAMMITLAAVMTGINAEAQRRSQRTEQNNRSHRTERVNPRHEKRYQTQHTPQKHEYNKKYQKKQQWRNKRDYHADRHIDLNRRYQHWDRDDHRNYSKLWDRDDHRRYSKHWDKHFRYDRKYAYVHPRYGHVYRRFHSRPTRVRYYNDDYYFYGGQCFRHYNGIGYVRIEFPRNLILASLPFQCERVWVGPHVYYRYGDMVFERCNLGYRLAPNIRIQLSAHF